MKSIEALHVIQTKLNAPKNQYNNFGKYSYRNLEDICAALKPLLVETGAVFTMSDEVVRVGDRIYVKATAKLRGEDHPISAHGWAREPLEKKGMDSAQVTGATSSYARKYAANALFAIDDVKDADSMAPEQPRATPPKTLADWQKECNAVVKNTVGLDEWRKRNGNEIRANLNDIDQKKLRTWLDGKAKELAKKDTVGCPNKDNAPVPIAYCRDECKDMQGCPAHV